MQDGTVRSKLPRPSKPRAPAVSVEDQRLFRDALVGVTPLPERDRLPIAPNKVAIARISPVPPRVPLVLEGSGDELTARAPGVNRAQVASLRAGAIRCEESLDLHGLIVVEAMPRLERFLVMAARARRRCVRVVHGKGLHSDGVATLRDAVIAALATELSGLVHAFSMAPPKDGGAGATIVLVRQ